MSKPQFVALLSVGIAVICYVSSLLLFVSTAVADFSQVLIVWFFFAGLLSSVVAVLSSHMLKMSRTIRFTSLFVFVIFVVSFVLPFVLLATTGFPAPD